MDSSSHIKSQLEMSRNVHDMSGVDKLRRAAQQGDEGALREAAQQFESLFVQMMLKSMRKAQDALSDENSPFNSQQVKFYRDMHDQQLAVDLSSRGTIGIADLIVQQMRPGENGFMPASALRNDANLSSLNRHTVKSIEEAQQQVLDPRNSEPRPHKTSAFASPQEFVQTLMPYAREAAQQLGLEPDALLAQAAVETGWGKYMIHDAKGNNVHNLFGIKADSRWQGNATSIDTLEYDNGVASRQKAIFRQYDSFAESFQDYVNFVSSQPRYQQAMEKSEDAKAYFSALQQAGYASDPAYAEKVMKVMDSDLMNSSRQQSSFSELNK